MHCIDCQDVCGVRSLVYLLAVQAISYFHRLNPCARDGQVFMGLCCCVPHLGSCATHFELERKRVKKIMLSQKQKRRKKMSEFLDLANTRLFLFRLVSRCM